MKSIFNFAGLFVALGGLAWLVFTPQPSYVSESSVDRSTELLLSISENLKKKDYNSAWLEYKVMKEQYPESNDLKRIEKIADAMKERAFRQILQEKWTYNRKSAKGWGTDWTAVIFSEKSQFAPKREFVQITIATSNRPENREARVVVFEQGLFPESCFESLGCKTKMAFKGNSVDVVLKPVEGNEGWLEIISSQNLLSEMKKSGFSIGFNRNESDLFEFETTGLDLKKIGFN